MRKFTDKINESAPRLHRGGLEDKIPTAEQLLLEIMECLKLDHGLEELNENDPELVPYLLEEINKRTKLHVEAALKSASEKVRLTDFAYEFLQEGAYDAIDKESILNAYPLDNIK
jgi:hypothetical protein